MTGRSTRRRRSRSDATRGREPARSEPRTANRELRRANREERTATSEEMTHTDYLWFNTAKRQEFVRITDDVAAIVTKSGVREGMVLVSAMHITAGDYVNDWEDGLI